MKKQWFSQFPALLLFALAWVSCVQGQTAGTGALTGTVTDPAGGVVPRVTITATNTDTGQERTTNTAGDGSYTIGLLPPGTYRVRFAAAGFKTAKVESVKINVTETPVLDRRLEVGAQAEQVTVSEVTEAIQTSTSTLGTVLGTASVAGLPLSTRNYTNLLALSAGANASVNNATALGRGSLDIAVNGAGTGQNNFQMDGASVMNFASFGTTGDATASYVGLGVPSPDSLAEFKIQTSLYDAGYGRNPGANVNVITKSGTNAFHGTAFEFFRNTQLNANDFFFNRTGQSRPILNQNQFGGVLGGPIKKDKLFFFFSTQLTKQKNGAAAEGRSPSVILPPIPDGDRSNTAAFQAALGAAVCQQNHPGDARYSAEGVQVACNGSNVNPVAIKLLQTKLPDGSYLVPGSTNGSFQPHPFSVPAIFNEYQYMGNVDYLVNSKNTIATRYFYNTAPETIAFAPGCGIASACLPGAPATINNSVTSAQLKLTTIVTTNLVNEVRGSYLRNVGVGRNLSTLTNSQFGIKPLVPQVDFLSPMSVIGVFGFNSSFDIQDTADNQFQYADQISWTHGKHTIRAGFEFERVLWFWNYVSLSKGFFLYPSFPDFLLGLPGCTPGTFPASCNPGNPGGTTGVPVSSIISTIFATRTPGYGNPQAYRAINSSAFVNDDIKISPRLTVNLGLRWEFDGLVDNKYGKITNVWPTLVATQPIPGNSAANGTFVGFAVPHNYQGVPGQAPAPPPAGVTISDQNIASHNSTPLDNFAPRFGFAWQPAGGNRFVVRGGFGVFYNRVPGNNFIHSAQEAQPYANPVNKAGGDNYFASLASPFQPGTSGWNFSRWVNLTTGQSSGIGQTTVQEFWRTPVTYSWNLNIQYEFLPRWVLEAGYVGSHGIHEDNTHGINIASLASASNPLYGVVTTNTVANAAARVPLLGFGADPQGGLLQESTDGNYKFNSLQVTVRKQMSHGFMMQGAYTFSRAFADYGLGGGGGESRTNNPLDSGGNWGPSRYYRPQRLVLSYSWDIPSGGRSGFAGKLASGWNISGVTTIQDGFPFTILDKSGGTIYGSSTVNSRAQMAAGKTYADILTPGDIRSNLDHYFNATAFTNLPAIGDGTGWGNSGVGVVLGPGQFNWDISAAKSTKVGGIREDATLQFRAEFFNAFNHAQFSISGTTGLTAAQGIVRGNADFGLITNTSVNPRLIQLALKYVF